MNHVAAQSGLNTNGFRDLTAASFKTAQVLCKSTVHYLLTFV